MNKTRQPKFKKKKGCLLNTEKCFDRKYKYWYTNIINICDFMLFTMLGDKFIGRMLKYLEV